MTITTKEKILIAAVEQFSVKGFRGTTIREIGKAVGIKESSIYNHYSNKDAILDAILEYQKKSFVVSQPTFESIETIALKHHDATAFWLEVAKAFIQRIPPLIEPINQLLANEMYLNEKCRAFITESMFVQQKILTKLSFEYMYQKGWIRYMNFEDAATQYVYMLYGLETENRIKRLSGESEEKIIDLWQYHVGNFIDCLK